MQNLHIIHDFDQAITSLRAEVISMAGRARHNLERAILLESVGIATPAVQRAKHGRPGEVAAFGRLTPRMPVEETDGGQWARMA